MGKEYKIQILDINVYKIRKIIKANKGKRLHKNIHFELNITPKNNFIYYNIINDSFNIE